MRVDEPARMLSAHMGLGQNIARLRIAAGHDNAAAFAREIGVKPGYLNDLEKGRYKDLRLSSVLRIAKKLQVPIDELLSDVDAEYDAMRRDLLRQAAAEDGSKPRPSGGRSESAQTRLLGEVTRAYQTLATEVQALHQDLGVIVARVERDPLGLKDRAVAADASNRRRRRGTAR